MNLPQFATWFPDNTTRAECANRGTCGWLSPSIFCVLLGIQLLSAGELPEGNKGIASRYPGDGGIEKDPAVLFVDGFESYSMATQLTRAWDAVNRAPHLRIAREPANVFEGAQSLEFVFPKLDSELALAVARVLKAKQDTLFLRYYSKFDQAFDVVDSSHNGAGISAGYYVEGRATPGVPADGKNKFLVNLENWRARSDLGKVPNPGRLNVYIYHPLQRGRYGDHFFPSGTVLPNSSRPFDFGPSFKARPEVTQKLGRWYCYELMLKANTVGKTDGRVAGWLDGKLVADFPNLRLRDVAGLKIDRFHLGLHIGRNTSRPTKKWYDSVVAATSYIGPTTPTVDEKEKNKRNKSEDGR